MCNNINAKQNRCEYRGVAQFGRAPRSGRGGRKFESCHLDHWKAGRIGVLYEKNTYSALFKFILLKPYSYLCMNRAFFAACFAYDRLYSNSSNVFLCFFITLFDFLKVRIIFCLFQSFFCIKERFCRTGV